MVQPPGVGQPLAPPRPGAQPGVAKPAAPRPLTQEVIDETISRGVEYLQQTQNANGIWGEGTIGGGGHAVGYTALVGIALLENGSSTSSPSIRRAAEVVRAGAPKLDGTYEVALAIMFLDRMRDKRDVPMIRMLASRLIGGQTPTGGWPYKLPSYGPVEAELVLGTLKRIAPDQQQGVSAPNFRERPSAMGLCIKLSDDIRPRTSTQAALDPAQAEKKQSAAVKGLPPNLKRLSVFQQAGPIVDDDPKEKAENSVAAPSDNSNTHFAMLGLWTARRHEVPTERSFALLSRRFRTSQSPEGGWIYTFSRRGSGGAPAMTSVALLGMAIGHALGVDPGAVGRPEQDPSILKALTWLSGQVGAPTGQTTDRPNVKDVGGLYYLWALERIAVLYDLKTLDDKDWYKWGAEILVCHQLTNGSWGEGGFPGEHPILNTALAVLFLKRANLTPDLSKRLMVDPNALTTKVNTTPPKPAPPPEPKLDLSALFGSQATPPPKEEPTPPPTTTAVSTAPPTAEAPPPKKSAPIWPWLAGGLGLLAVIGIGLVFALRRKPKDEDDEDEDKPKKKGKSKGAGKAGKVAKSKD
ncbi:MAG: hypothetical protein JWO38_1529 [Gemmataceae bacterium]|nr:hypothetical protein [Gemmataceae bacterium]